MMPDLAKESICYVKQPTMGEREVLKHKLKKISLERAQIGKLKPTLIKKSDKERILFEIYENGDFIEIMKSLTFRFARDTKKSIILNEKYSGVKRTWDLVLKSHF